MSEAEVDPLDMELSDVIFLVVAMWLVGNALAVAGAFVYWWFSGD